MLVPNACDLCGLGVVKKPELIDVNDTALSIVKLLRINDILFVVCCSGMVIIVSVFMKIPSRVVRRKRIDRRTAAGSC